MIEAAKKRLTQKDEVFDVWEENWESFLFFLDVSNHWVIVSRGMAGKEYVGLNYSNIESIVRTFKPVKKSKREALYRDLRTIELAVLPLLNNPKKG